MGEGRYWKDSLALIDEIIENFHEIHAKFLLKHLTFLNFNFLLEFNKSRKFAWISFLILNQYSHPNMAVHLTNKARVKDCDF
jgi:hypothetical protein